MLRTHLPPLSFMILLGLGGCARSTPAAVPQATSTEPIFDTIGEFRRGERIACADGTDLVYVVARDGGLHSFDARDLRFRRIGTLRCPGTAYSHPHSMAVDRSGQAWVGYDNGVLALARISDASCTSSKVDVPSAGVGPRFGMGFAPTPEGGIGGETLFLAVPSTRMTSILARIDDGTNITIAGRFPATLGGQSGELSSRADGKLFAFFTGDPFELVEIDPSTAAVRWQRRLEGMHFAEPHSGSWAFAAVGSEFFFFWANRDAPSTVTRLKEDGTIEHVIQDAGIQIVGAGASTCATRAPKAKEDKTSEGSPSDPIKVEPPTKPELAKPEPPKPEPVPHSTAPTPFSKLPPLPPPTGKLPPTKPKVPKPKPRVR